MVVRRRTARYAAPAPTSPTSPSPATKVIGVPESGPFAAAAVVSPDPVLPLGDTVTDPVGAVDVESFGRTVVADGLAPGVGPADEPEALLPACGVEPDVLEPLGVAGVVPAGLGLAAGGLLDELDGLGRGVGFGAGLGAAAGGALLGAPPDPKANPITLPVGGS